MSWKFLKYLDPLYTASQASQALGGPALPNIADSITSGKVGGNEIRSYFDAFSGKSSVQAQYDAIKANMQMNSDTNMANVLAAEKTNEMNYKIWQEAKAENRNYFDETNAWNSAAAQMERFKQAGLNPALSMYGGVDAGTAHASTAPASPNLATPVHNAYYQQPVDFTQMQSFPGRLIGMAQQFGLAQSALASGRVDQNTIGSRIAQAQATADLVSQQYSTEVYKSVIAYKEGLKLGDGNKLMAWADKNLDFGIQNALTQMQLLEFAPEKERATIDQIVAVGKQAFENSINIHETTEFFKASKGSLTDFEKSLGSATDNILYKFAKMLYFMWKTPK